MMSFIMNLIRGIYHSCEWREFTFIVFLKILNNHSKQYRQFGDSLSRFVHKKEIYYRTLIQITLDLTLLNIIQFNSFLLDENFDKFIIIRFYILSYLQNIIY